MAEVASRPVNTADSGRTNGPGDRNSARGTLASANGETCDGSRLTVEGPKRSSEVGIELRHQIAKRAETLFDC